MSQTENRNSSVQTIYDARAVGYEDSWHPKFAKQFLTLVDKPPIAPGNRVIDLACGTGLVLFLVAQQVSPKGHVWGLDISSGMLKVAREKVKQLTEEQRDTIILMQREIEDLTKIDAFVGLEDTFDLITCCSALVLLEDPGAAIRNWAEFLKPVTGRLIVDVPHPVNQPSGRALETALLKLGIPSPHHRDWVKSKDSLSDLISQGGKLEVEKVVYIEQPGGGKSSDGGSEEASKAYDDLTGPGKTLDGWLQEHDSDAQKRIREGFTEAWAARANASGKIEDVAGVYVAVARRR